MPRRTTGSLFATRDGYGVRWPEDGRGGGAGGRRQRTGFRTKTEAHRSFAEQVAPRLIGAARSPEITFDALARLFLARHGATVWKRTRDTLSRAPRAGRQTFGAWTLLELEERRPDIRRWRAGPPRRHPLSPHDGATAMPHPPRCTGNT